MLKINLKTKRNYGYESATAKEVRDLNLYYYFPTDEEAYEIIKTTSQFYILGLKSGEYPIMKNNSELKEGRELIIPFKELPPDIRIYQKENSIYND